MLHLAIHRRLLSAFFAIVVLSSCAGSDDFAREDAINALETTGASEAEATCMADTLDVLGRVEAADPRRDRTSQDHEALVSASGRCIGTGSVPDVEVAGTQIVNPPASDPEPSASGVSGGSEYSEPTGSDAGARRQRAISRLESFGRTVEDATCIVDQLIEVYADDVFDSPNFGVGLDPFEAHAFVVCAAGEI